VNPTCRRQQQEQQRQQKHKQQHQQSMSDGSSVNTVLAAGSVEGGAQPICRQPTMRAGPSL
jgi:hypothetical protein